MIYRVMKTKGDRAAATPWALCRDSFNGDGWVEVLRCSDRKHANACRKQAEAITRALDDANYRAIGADKIVDHLRRMGVEGSRYTRACIASAQDDGKGGKYYRYAHCVDVDAEKGQ